MFKNKILYIGVLVLCFLLLVFIEYFTPKAISWKRTYSKDDKIPYGSYLVYELLPQIFGNKAIIANNKTFYELLEEGIIDSAQENDSSIVNQANQGINFVLLNEDFSPNELMQILEDNLTKRNLVWDQNIENILINLIEGVVKTRRQGFGNAGDMVTMADSIERKCKSRSLNIGLADACITVADIPEQYQFFLP